MTPLAEKLRKTLKPRPRVEWEIQPQILLHPNIPKPMHGVAPRVVLGLNWWNRERLLSYKSTDFHCQACGVHKLYAKYHQWLEAHELYDIDYAKGRMKYLRSVPLCHFCHNYIHDGRLQMLLDRGEIHHAKFVAIIKHGDSVLKAAGIKKLSHEKRDELILNGPLAEWSKWRLVIGRKHYKPLYNSYEEWSEAFE